MAKARSSWEGVLGGAGLGFVLWLAVGLLKPGPGSLEAGFVWLMTLPVALLGGAVYGYRAVKKAPYEWSRDSNSDRSDAEAARAFPVVNPHERRD